jgi:hypothetical protein
MAEQIVDAADMMGGHRTGPPHFPAECIRSLRTRGGGTNGFQGDRLSEAAIVGFIDLAHAASGDKPDDLETVAKHVAGGEGASRFEGRADCFEDWERAIEESLRFAGDEEALKEGTKFRAGGGDLRRPLINGGLLDYSEKLLQFTPALRGHISSADLGV